MTYIPNIWHFTGQSKMIFFLTQSKFSASFIYNDTTPKDNNQISVLYNDPSCLRPLSFTRKSRMGFCISEGNISQGRVLISVLWWDWLTTTPAVLLSIYDKKHLLVMGCWGSSEKKHELPGRLSLEKVSHTIIIKVSFLHPVEENMPCLNLDLNPHHGWGLRSCRCPSLFLAFLCYLFKQKRSFFCSQGYVRKQQPICRPCARLQVVFLNILMYDKGFSGAQIKQHVCSCLWGGET